MAKFKEEQFWNLRKGYSNLISVKRTQEIHSFFPHFDHTWGRTFVSSSSIHVSKHLAKTFSVELLDWEKPARDDLKLRSSIRVTSIIVPPKFVKLKREIEIERSRIIIISECFLVQWNHSSFSWLKRAQVNKFSWFWYCYFGELLWVVLVDSLNLFNRD